MVALRRPSLIGQLIPAVVLTGLVSIAGVAWWAGRAVRDSHMQTVTQQLGHEARLMELDVEPLLSDRADPVAIQDRIDRFDAAADLRVTIIASDGRVLADSRERAEAMDNHADRPEVIEARALGMGRAVRYSKTRRIDMIYVATTSQATDPPTVVRVAMPLTELKKAIGQVYLRIALGGLAGVAVMVGLLLYVVDRKVRRPIAAMQRGAQRIADGQLDQYLPLPDAREPAALADALNRMADQLQDRLRALADQRDRIDAVLAAAADGVLVLGPGQLLIRANPAAARMLALDLPHDIGQPMYEVLRSRRLNDLLERAAAGGATERQTIELPGDPEDESRLRAMAVSATPLAGAAQGKGELVLTLHDVTAEHRLETVRRALVTNVSHELRTPLAAIGGAAEALADSHPPSVETIERFVPMIKRNVDRLTRLADDLSALGQTADPNRRHVLHVEPTSLASAGTRAVAALNELIDRRQVEIRNAIPKDLLIPADPVMLSQSLEQLLRNAVVHGPTGGTVELAANVTGDRVDVTVTDRGPGIAPEHLPRLFEHLYQVDPSRRRSPDSGAGLGLAIVKHIAMAHGGRVWVESTPGRGSTFHMELPKSPSNPTYDQS